MDIYIYINAHNIYSSQRHYVQSTHLVKFFMEMEVCRNYRFYTEEKEIKSFLIIYFICLIIYLQNVNVYKYLYLLFYNISRLDFILVVEILSA